MEVVSDAGYQYGVGPIVDLGLYHHGDTFSFTGFNVSFDVFFCSGTSTSCDQAASNSNPVGFSGVWLKSNNNTSIPTTPLPATLPLFMTGLCGLGFLTWRRGKKKRGASKAAA